MYEDTSAKVIILDGEMETFNILAGILQEDKLDPYLLLLTTSREKLEWKGRKAWFTTKEETKQKGTIYNSHRYGLCGRYSLS